MAGIRKTLAMVALLAGCSGGPRLLDVYDIASVQTAWRRPVNVSLDGNGSVTRFIYPYSDSLTAEYINCDIGNSVYISQHPFLLVDPKTDSVFFDSNIDGIVDSIFVSSDKSKQHQLQMGDPCENVSKFAQPDWFRRLMQPRSEVGGPAIA